MSSEHHEAIKQRSKDEALLAVARAVSRSPIGYASTSCVKKQLKRTRAVVSKRLAILRDTGMVEVHTLENRYPLYKLTVTGMARVRQLLQGVSQNTIP